ncbi:type II secretion system protein N [Thermaurantiacus sp.]
MPALFRAPGWGAAILAALALLTLAAGLRAVAAARSATGPAPAPRAPAADLSILARFDPFFRDAPTAAADELPVSALPLALKGVRLDPASGRGVAFIAGADGQQALYAPGEAVADGVTLARIESDRVVLAAAGRLEALWLDEAAGPAPVTAAASAPAAAAPVAAGTGAASPRPDEQGDVVVEPPSVGMDAEEDA